MRLCLGTPVHALGCTSRAYALVNAQQARHPGSVRPLRRQSRLYDDSADTPTVCAGITRPVRSGPLFLHVPVRGGGGYRLGAGRAWVFAQLACERAALKDDLGSGRILDQAQTAAARVRHVDPGSGWWSTQGQLAGWDGVRPNVLTGKRSLMLGRSAEAVRRATVLKDLTEACVGVGDPDRACAAAVASLDDAEAYGLATIPARIRKARMTFPARWGTLASVRELDERLALAS